MCCVRSRPILNVTSVPTRPHCASAFSSSSSRVHALHAHASSQTLLLFKWLYAARPRSPLYSRSLVFQSPRRCYWGCLPDSLPLSPCPGLFTAACNSSQQRTDRSSGVCARKTFTGLANCSRRPGGGVGRDREGGVGGHLQQLVSAPFTLLSSEWNNVYFGGT